MSPLPSSAHFPQSIRSIRASINSSFFHSCASHNIAPPLPTSLCFPFASVAENYQSSNLCSFGRFYSGSFKWNLGNFSPHKFDRYFALPIIRNFFWLKSNCTVQVKRSAPLARSDRQSYSSRFADSAFTIINAPVIDLAVINSNSQFPSVIHSISTAPL